MGIPCEVVGLFEGPRRRIRPLRIRYYVLEKAAYHVVEVEAVDFVRVESTSLHPCLRYRIHGRRKNLRILLDLLYDEKEKRWWVVP